MKLPPKDEHIINLMDPTKESNNARLRYNTSRVCDAAHPLTCSTGAILSIQSSVPAKEAYFNTPPPPTKSGTSPDLEP